ncbi:MAG TPA: hypothetical protein VND68_07455 [Chloroflexia bacterium]|jgi:hypothetical protein|nr:hypothetical protein [Chloroflexia bacterium]
MIPYADIVIRNLDGNAVAAVEVKNSANLSRDVAIELRRTLIEHGYVPVAPYFLIISQESGFLWKDAGSVALDAPPTQEFSMAPVLRRYLSQVDTKDRLSGSVLELLVLQWLNEIAFNGQQPTEDPERLLASSGFLDSLRNAMILVEANP